MNSSIYLRRMWVVLWGISSLAWTARLASGADSPPFFPLGLTCVDTLPPYSNKVTEEFPDIAAAGFNLVETARFQYGGADETNTNEHAKAYLDAAQRSGLKVIMGIPFECVERGESACIQERVLKLKDHPALYGWNVMDEPELFLKTPDPVGDLVSAYQQIKRLDPRHPVIISTAESVVDTNYRFRQAADIVMNQLLVIPVSVFYSEWGEEATLGNVIRHMVASSSAFLTNEGKSLLPQVQIYNLAGDGLIWPKGVPRSRGGYPTREEMRFSAYYSIILGAKGLVFNCYRYNYEDGTGGDDVSKWANPQQWEAVSSVSKELKEMTPILLAPTQERQRAGVTLRGEAPVEMLIKHHQGKTYLLTVNASPEPVQRQIRLARDRFPNPTVTLLPQRQRISFQSGSFDAQWSPYEVRVYEIGRGGS
ncbi:MAG: hypothetical protein HYZ73_08130 [Elusimicrobia bacterium]|nr:hypothetical protein [Elusimicrobiota bacterium]